MKCACEVHLRVQKELPYTPLECLGHGKKCPCTLKKEARENNQESSKENK